MKKILISENNEKANAFISELENIYLASVSAVYIKIQALGVEIPSKKFLFDVIRGDMKALQAKCEDLIKPDIETFKSPIAQAQTKKAFDERMDEIRKTVEALFFSTKEINNRRLNDKYFEQFIDIDESGKPYISDETIASIEESFKEYIDSAEGEKVYNMQQSAAKALDDFLGALYKAKLEHGINLAPKLFLMKHFNLVEEKGRYRVSAEPMDYNSND